MQKRYFKLRTYLYAARLMPCSCMIQGRVGLLMGNEQISGERMMINGRQAR